MSTLEELGALIVNAGRDGFSPSVRNVARLHLVDTIGAWAAGAATPEGRLVSKISESLQAIPGFQNYSEALLQKVVTRCALARLTEIDAIDLSTMITPSAIVVPTALTIASALGPESHAQVLEAIVVGCEAMVRIGMGLGGARLRYRGVWPTYFVAPVGAAAVAARMFGLTEQQAVHGLGIALTAASPSVGHQKGPATSRWVLAGHAARAGVWAALLAKQGMLGDPDIFESRFFPSLYGVTPDIAAINAGVGENPAIMATSFKPWCAARQTMAATVALKEIIESGIAPEAITGVTAFVPGLEVEMIDHGVVPGDRTSFITSVQYQMALAALQPEAMYDVAQTPAVISPPVQALMSKIKVEADDGLLSQYPAEWHGRVLVFTASGKCERLVTQVPGDPGRPFDEAKIAAKFRRVVSPILGTHAAEELLALALKAAEGGGVERLVAALDAKAAV